MSGFWLEPGKVGCVLWDSKSYLNLVFWLPPPDTALAEGGCPSLYCQVGVEVQSPHLASVDTQGDGAPFYCWKVMEFWLPPLGLNLYPLTRVTHYSPLLAPTDITGESPDFPQGFFSITPLERERGKPHCYLVGMKVLALSLACPDPIPSEMWDALWKPCEGGGLVPLLWLYWHGWGRPQCFRWCLAKWPVIV